MATNRPDEYGRQSLWRRAAEFGEAEARDLAGRLELRASAPDEVEAREEYLRLLDLGPGDSVLDVGCGSGVVTRAIARRVAPGGRVTGCDISPALLAVARDLAEKDGLSENAEFLQGDCGALPFPDATFDAVIAVTVLAHVPDGPRALAEMVRVTRPGGKVGVFDLDGDSLVISHSDRALTRRIVAATSDHTAVDSWLARRIPSLLANLGVDGVRARGFMSLDRDAKGFYASLARRGADVAAKVGEISADEAARWTAALEEEIQADRFLGGRLHIFAWGVKRG